MIHGDLIGRWGRTSPEREALYDVTADRRYTYGELSRGIYRLANYLRDGLGIGRGGRVACLSFNRAEYIMLFFALGRLGAILVPLNFRLAMGEFAYFLDDAKPEAFFYDAFHAETVARLRQESVVRHFICFDEIDQEQPGLVAELVSCPDDPPPGMDIGPDDPHLIIYTSGTTGSPKGVVLTHGMMTWNGINTNLGWDLRSSDRTILHAAMFYTAGWNVFTLPVFQARGANILIKSFEADLVLRLIAEEGVTVFFGVPTMYQMLLESPLFKQTDFSSVRFLVSGGAPLPLSIVDAFQREKGLRIWEGYGLTEIGPNNFLADGKPGTVGRPMPFVEMQLVDDGGRRVGAGQDGEILLKGPHICAGYWNEPEETARAIKDGWFHTGDLGRLDHDGDLAIVGRKKDLIISGGANIYPAEIERAVELHPQVAGAAVIGVPDQKWGEAPKAIVELVPGGSLTLEDLLIFLADRLGRFKLPKYLKVVDELPRTPASAKIQKFLLKKQHGGADND